MSDTQNFDNVVLYLSRAFGVRLIRCRILEVKTGQKYAQYDNAVKLTWVAPGKRKAESAVLSFRPWCRIVAAAGAINPQSPLNRQADGSSISRYSSYDPRYVTDFEDSLTASGIAVLLAIGEGEREKCMRCVDRIATTIEGGSHVCGLCASVVRNEMAWSRGEMNPCE